MRARGEQFQLERQNIRDVENLLLILCLISDGIYIRPSLSLTHHGTLRTHVCCIYTAKTDTPYPASIVSGHYRSTRSQTCNC